MKNKHSFLRLILVSAAIVSLGTGTLFVHAEPEDEPTTYEEPYQQESYQEPYVEPEYSYDEPEYSEPDYSDQSEEPYEPEEPESSYNYYEDSSDPYYEEPEQSSQWEYSEEESAYSYEPSYEESSYYYEESSQVTEYSYEEATSQPSEEVSGYEYPSDTSEMTSEDWERLNNERLKNSTASTLEISASSFFGTDDEALKKIKESKESASNDDWVYLIWGIALIAVGVGAILVVVFTSMYSKRKLARQAQTGGKPPKVPEAPKTPKTKPSDTGEIVFRDSEEKKKDDYDDFFDQT